MRVITLIRDEIKGNSLLVEGPAEFEVLKGSVSVFGCPVSRLSIPNGKVLPLYMEEDTSVRITDDAHVIPLEGSPIPGEWDSLLERIISEDYRKIMFVGHSDTGKSSAITYMIKRVEGQQCVLDTDIGQADVSPPASIGLAIAEEKIPGLSYLKLYDAFFIGKTSPAKIELRCLRGIASMIKKAEEISDMVFIDTTGWVYGIGAREYKLAKIGVIDPDLIVCMGRDIYYLRDYNRVVLPSFVVKKRDKIERAEFRERKFREGLRNGKRISVKLDEVRIMNSMLFSGNTLTDEELKSLEKLVGIRLIYGEKSDDFIVLLTDEPVNIRDIMPDIKTVKALFEIADVRLYTLSHFENLLLGIRKDRFMGIGVMKNIRLEDREIEIFTSVPREDVETVEFGMMKITEDGRELGFVEYY